MEVTEEDILLAQRIISAAGRHDNAALSILLKEGSANVRDQNGLTPIHAAVASATKKNEATANDTVQLLLTNGAIWNDINDKDDTPGCVALRSGLSSIYETMVEAGVRAELLFNKMSALGLTAGEDAEVTEEEEEVPQDVTTGAAEDDDVSKSNHTYLKSELRYQRDILLDSSDNAVMMSWETEIMQLHAKTLIPTAGLRAMNVGHGMGIVDTAIQTHSPAEHHIIEAHPQVLQRLRETGWYDKPNVHIHEGRWQDVVPKLIEKGIVLDAIYYDTFAEDYLAFKDFVDEGVIPLLDNEGRFGWYNGLGADRQICYDVYTRVAEMDLYEAGFETEWTDVKVPEDLKGSKDWEATRRPYWTIDVYRLPVNTFVK